MMATIQVTFLNFSDKELTAVQNENPNSKPINPGSADNPIPTVLQVENDATLNIQWEENSDEWIQCCAVPSGCLQEEMVINNDLTWGVDVLCNCTPGCNGG